MPVYDYRCRACGHRQSVFQRGFNAQTPSCTRCGSDELLKLVSRFATLRSEEGHMESLLDPSSLGGLDENDPRSMARWARRMARETGEDLGDEFHDMVERMEAGEMPEETGEGGGEEGDLDL